MPEAKIISTDGWVGNAPLLRLSLLGHFSLRADGLERSLTEGSRRLLALLALTGQRIRRPMVAGTLWPEASDVRAGACLRSAVARLGHTHADVLWANATELSLSAAVRVDLREAEAEARRLLACRQPLCDADRCGESVEQLSLEILPGWYDEWVLMKAEVWRQLRLHALEALSMRLTAAACHAEAIHAALAAVATDPLRESARSVLIRAHIAEGNRSEAHREFERYRDLMHSSLGMEPTTRLRTLAGAASRPSRHDHSHVRRPSDHVTRAGWPPNSQRLA
jgi:SARP family transcriptional regulator, regulator of embCAB operon